MIVADAPIWGGAHQCVWVAHFNASGWRTSCGYAVLWRWCKRRHPNKGMKWIRQRYFCSRGHRNWVFFSKYKTQSGENKHLELREISHTPIRRHIKIKADATPYDPAYKEYIANRLQRQRNKMLFRPCKDQWSAWWELEPMTE